jgi:ABC-type branched-subunit amino acid transport system ATPase component/predicted MFS family arabinose efflux permease
VPAATAVEAGEGALSPQLTPRLAFHLTRRLAGVSRYPLGLLTAIYAINQMHQFLVPVLFPFFKEEFHISDTALGFLAGSYLFMLTLGSFPFGILADRVSRTKVIGWGTAAWGGAMLYAGLAPNYGHLLAARIMLGVADPADNPTSQSLLADYYPVNQRAKVMGIYEGGRLLGILALPIAGAMAQAWGWRTAFYFFALPGFLVALLAWHLPEPERGEQDRLAQNLQAGARKSEYERMGSARAYMETLRVPTFLVQLISSGVANFFLGGIGVWTVTFLIRFHDFEVSEASAAVGLFALGALVGSLSAGYVADYLTFKGFTGGRVWLAAACRIGSFSLFMPTFIIGNVPIMLVLFFVAAALLVAPVPLLNAVRADVLHPNLRGRGNALDGIVQSSAGAISPILFGALSDVVNLRGAFLILTPLVGVGGILLLLLGPRFYTRDSERVLRQVADEAVEGDGRRRARAPSTRESKKDLLLEVRDVDFSYGPLQALFGVSLDVPKGGCVALLGPNGAGKTTFLKVVAGLLEPQRGRILYKGIDIIGVPPDQRARLGITLMAGGRSMFPSLTVLDNLWMGAFPFSKERESRALVQARLDAVLEVFPALRERLRQTAGTLSGGEQQMLALGRALMAGAELLLVDELSMGLAPVVTEQLLPVVHDVAAMGTTILLVEQSATVALNVADEIYFMEKGAARRLGTAASVRRKGDLERLMLFGRKAGR